MKSHLRTLTAIAFMLMLIISITGCSSDQETTTANPVAAGASDEESSVRYGLTDTYDNIRGGARLVLSYDASTDAFKGTVTNTTGAILTQVRVEVHLYDGTVTVDELGPMLTPNVLNIDLNPGESHSVTLPAMGHSFTEWVAHPEVGPSSGGGGEGGAEGGGEGGGEHGGGEGGAHN